MLTNLSAYKKGQDQNSEYPTAVFQPCMSWLAEVCAHFRDSAAPKVGAEVSAQPAPGLGYTGIPVHAHVPTGPAYPRDSLPKVAISPQKVSVPKEFRWSYQASKQADDSASFRHSM